MFFTFSLIRRTESPITSSTRNSASDAMVFVRFSELALPPEIAASINSVAIMTRM